MSLLIRYRFSDDLKTLFEANESSLSISPPTSLIILSGLRNLNTFLY